MPTKQGDVALLNDPVAQQLLESKNLAKLAYTWTDGSPRVLPIWFHWDGRQIVLGTPPAAPKMKALARNPESCADNRHRRLPPQGAIGARYRQHRGARRRRAGVRTGSTPVFRRWRGTLAPAGRGAAPGNGWYGARRDRAGVGGYPRFRATLPERSRESDVGSSCGLARRRGPDEG